MDLTKSITKIAEYERGTTPTSIEKLELLANEEYNSQLKTQDDTNVQGMLVMGMLVPALALVVIPMVIKNSLKSKEKLIEEQTVFSFN